MNRKASAQLPASAIVAPFPHDAGSSGAPGPAAPTGTAVVPDHAFAGATSLAVALVAVVLAVAVASVVRNRHRAVAAAPGL